MKSKDSLFLIDTAMYHISLKLADLFCEDAVLVMNVKLSTRS